jgi:hypothetical protein
MTRGVTAAVIVAALTTAVAARSILSRKGPHEWIELWRQLRGDQLNTHEG